jgi:hypothetical protein
MSPQPRPYARRPSKKDEPPAAFTARGPDVLERVDYSPSMMVLSVGLGRMAAATLVRSGWK